METTGIDQILTSWQRLCEVNPDLGWEKGASVQIVIAGEDQQEESWLCCFYKPPRIIRGRERCAAQVCCDAASLIDLAQGKLSLLELTQLGRIEGKGDRDSLTRFGLFLGSLIAADAS